MNGLTVIAQELAAKVNLMVSDLKVPVPQLSNLATPTSFKSSRIPAKFQPFTVGSLGNFPYYWQDPRTLKFNPKTYDWISSNLKANASPIQLDERFTNVYISVLSKVIYSLSSEDQEKLNQAQQDTIDQQGSLLRAWQAAFGSIPSGKQPIDMVMEKITQIWASPPTTLQQLQTTPDLKGVLNQMPASGASVLPALSNYLNALNSRITLLNATTMNRGYLTSCLEAVQNPQPNNGALETSDGEMHPAYTITTPLQDILDSLNCTDKSNTVTLKRSVTRRSSTEYSVAMKGSNPVNLTAADFLSFRTDRDTELFQDKIIIDSNPTEVEITYRGVTIIYYGPVAFSMTSSKNWYWITPIRDAIKNNDSDVSGFKFSPEPQISFNKSRSFGFLTGVAISKNPSPTFTKKCANYRAIAQAVDKIPSGSLKFLGRPLVAMGMSPNYTPSAVVNDADSSVQVNFEPSAAAAKDSMDSTAFVLGVQSEFPAS